MPQNLETMPDIQGAVMALKNLRSCTLKKHRNFWDYFFHFDEAVNHVRAMEAQTKVPLITEDGLMILFMTGLGPDYADWRNDLIRRYRVAGFGPDDKSNVSLEILQDDATEYTFGMRYDSRFPMPSSLHPLEQWDADHPPLIPPPVRTQTATKISAQARTTTVKQTREHPEREAILDHTCYVHFPASHTNRECRAQNPPVRRRRRTDLDCNDD